MNRKSKFQPGTKVKILNPEFFVRCGYPETIESAKEKLKEEFENDNNQKLEKFLTCKGNMNLLF